MRLDKYLAEMSVGSRSIVKNIIKEGRIKVNDKIIKKSDYKINDNDKVMLDDQEIVYIRYEYILLNKPKDYISASDDKKQKTIMSLIKSKRKDLVPVGRLDKDTEGLMLITNDGKLNHELLSPHNHVIKKYYVEVNKPIRKDAIAIFANSMDLGDFKTKPSKLEIIDEYHAFLTISEGKYHQVKRMFKTIGCTVNYLKRVQFKNLTLDNLKVGQYRYLSKAEIEDLKRINS